MARDLPPASSCRACPARIRWMKTDRGRNIPLELEPDSEGDWVMDEDVTLGLVARPYQALRHGGMPRFRSHLERCRPVREEGPSMPAVRPRDPTAGLKFPRRRAVGPFPPLEQLICEAARERFAGLGLEFDEGSRTENEAAALERFCRRFVAQLTARGDGKLVPADPPAAAPESAP